MAKIYISGKITGLPLDITKRKFDLMEERLKAQGLEVENPFNNELPSGSTWEQYMLSGIKKLFTCDAILMQDGWQTSKGACIEYDIANRLGLVVIFETTMKQKRYEELKVMRIVQAIHEITGLQLHDYTQKDKFRVNVFARMLFAHNCKKENIKNADIARMLKLFRSSIPHLLKTYKNEVENNKDFRKMADAVDNILTLHE